MAGRVERNLSCIYLRFSDRRRAAWGGSVAVIAPAGYANEFGDGDMIVVKGTLVRLSDGACGSPSYLVVSLEEH